MRKRVSLLAAFLAVSVALLTSAAAARTPTTVQVSVNTALPVTGVCPFDLTFTSTGTITVTTYYDSAGNPRSESVHGALTHTLFSDWHTLTSNGPAPVHVDLATGQMVDTGKEYGFRIAGDGIVFGVAGRLVFAADGSVLSFAGVITDSPTLCTALGP